MRIFVYIATTQGLVTVQQVAEEEDNVQSVVCLNGTVESLPISPRYHEFVKKGTGLIHADFGHGAWRVDVSDRIDQGSSWQLGLYLAHYLRHIDFLGTDAEPAEGDVVLWATGVVKRNKSVAEVAAVEAKLLRSQQQLQQWQDQGINVQCFVPAANQADTKINHPLFAALPIHPLHNLEQALTVIDKLLATERQALPDQSVDSIGKYTIIKPLGEGGFGCVYLAHDPHLDAQVAIKLFRIKDQQLAAQITSATDDAAGVLKQRFIDEAKILRKLSANPFIVDMYDFDVTPDGSPYYTMPYLARSLKQVLGSDASDSQVIAELPAEQQPRQLPLPIALNYLQQILNALVPVHQAGLTHRDIKPANLLFNDDNQLQLCDFGIAKLPDGGYSQSGIGMGSHHYMSPEQHQSAKYVDNRSDVYSVAVLAYRMICGILPEGRFAEPIDYQPALLPAVNQLLLLAMSQNKAQRPADAEAFLQQLKTALADDTDEIAQGQWAEDNDQTFTEITPPNNPLKPALQSLVNKIEQLLTSTGQITQADMPTLQALADIGGLDNNELQALIEQMQIELAAKIQPLKDWLTSIDKHGRQAAVDGVIKTALVEAGRAIGLSDQIIEGHLQARLEPEPGSPEPINSPEPDSPEPETKSSPEPNSPEPNSPEPNSPEPNTKSSPDEAKWGRAASKADQSTKEETAWQTAQQSNSLQAFVDYLQAWPQGQYRDEADKQAWQLAQQQATTQQKPEIYDSYRELFPKGCGLSLCETKQRELTDNMASGEEDRAWQQAQKKDSYEAYQHYLESYPEGRYAAGAIENGELATWREASKKDRKSGYVTYLERYPEGTNVRMAEKFVERLTAQLRKRLIIAAIVLGSLTTLGAGAGIYYWTQLDNKAWAQTQEVNIPAAYLDFIEQYNDSEFVEAAQAAFRQLDEQAWQQIVSANDIAGYEAYRQQFPKGLFVKDAEQKIAAITELTDWQLADKTNDQAAYLHYLSIQPKGLHRPEALQRLITMADLTDWQAAEKANDIDTYQKYLAQHPQGTYVEQAKPLLAALLAAKEVAEQKQQAEQARLDKEAAERRLLILSVQDELIRLGYLEGQADGLLDRLTRQAVSDFGQDQRPRLSTKITDALLVQLKKTAKKPLPPLIQRIEKALVSIAGGGFTMGCNEGASDCDGDEKPRHQRLISSFKLLSHEVTWSMYQPCVAARVCPRASGKGEQPVTGVSWHDINQYYLPWLNRLSARKYRLPSEAQWEYAARAGSETRYHWGEGSDCAKALFGNTSNECNKPSQPGPVKQFPANAWGLYDMHGNAWEWLQDCWDSVAYQAKPETGVANVLDGDCNKRLIRGGSFKDGRWALRSSNRNNAAAAAQRNSIGFRLAQDLRRR